MLDVYDKLPVCHDIEDAKVRTKDVILDEEIKFSSLLLEEPIQRGLAKCGYKFLSPIQKNALPFALTGNSIIVHAKSGTGKTLIYLLTALNSYLKLKASGLFTLILAPTREIAKQVYDVCKNVSSFIEGLKVEYFIGGTSLDIDVLKCKTCCIAIGAPGRIKHLIDLGELKVQELKLLVLDEVDLLINNKEFAINEVISQLPVSRQNIVCTATYSDEIDVLLKPIAADLQYINMSEEERLENASSASNMLLGIKQYVLPVFSDSSVMDSVRKRNKLVDVLKNFHYDQCFVFVNYISLVKSVYNFLLKHELSALWLSSEQHQSTRVTNLNKLKLNECKILVTTDLAARGIDVHNANLVVNLSLPTPPDVYVHRMGRAGRYGSKGSVITIVYEGEELQMFEDLVRFVITEPVNLYVMPSEINAESLNSSLAVIKCDPKPDSIVIREFIAKHAAKMENQPMKSQNRKRKQRKTRTKEKLVQKCVPPKTAQDTKTPHFLEKETTESKPMMSHPQELEKLLSNFDNLLQNTLDTYTRARKPLSAVIEFAMPKKSTHSRLLFTDYNEIPNTQEEYGLTENVVPVLEPLLQLANSSRAENSFIDFQRLPLHPYEFFTSIDYDRIMNKWNNPIQVCKLKREVLEIIYNLLKIPPSINELAFSGADCSALQATSNESRRLDSGRLSSSTSDSQEPPTKLKPTRSKKSRHVPTASLNVDKLEGSQNTSRFTTNYSQPSSHSNVSIHQNFERISPVDYVSVPSPQRSYLPISQQGYLPKPPSDYKSIEQQDHVSRRSSRPILRTADKHVQDQPAVTANDVECPRCCHTFSVQSDSTNSQRTNVLTLLTPFVNFETGRRIYESHFNYISSCVKRVQFRHSDN